ncbi:MAG: hypothetical protein KDA58_14285, partial [Planctomycetaceae bacterium]|nr:hypothetical protein [Planctomycetaceae bacterium]
MTSLRAAIMEANALAGRDTIELPSGRYELSLSGAFEGNSRTGDLDVLEDLDLVGAGREGTMIDANQLDRIFDVRSGTLRLRGMSLSGGRDPGGQGGAIRVDAGGQLMLESVTLTGNSAASFGGAIYSSGIVHLIASQLTDNQAASGGALYIARADASTTIRDSELSGNRASNGAIYNLGELSLQSSLLTDNRPMNFGGLGGGIFNGGSGVLSIVNSTLSGNQAAYGGGLINYGQTHIQSVTITGNTGTIAGGGTMIAAGVVTLQNTIVANNVSANGPDVRGTVQSLGHNLVGNTTGSSGFGTQGDLLNLPARLGELRDNGGPTRTHLVQFGSPAIDAGLTAAAPFKDQRGESRPKGLNADIGAVEADVLVFTGTIFDDHNGNGRRDIGEGGLAGVQVFVDHNNNQMRDANEPVATTATDGTYALVGPVTDRSYIRVIAPAGTRQSTPGNDAGEYYGTIHATGGMKLVHIDGTTGQVEIVASPLTVDQHGLVVTKAGEFIGVNIFQDEYYEIDPVTGQATSILKVNLQVAAGLAYDAVTDTIYTVEKLTETASVFRLAKVDLSPPGLTSYGTGITGLEGTSSIIFDPWKRRVLSFDNTDDDIFAFELDGSSRLLLDTSNVPTWAMTYNGTSLVYPRTIDGVGRLVNLDLETGEQSPFMTLSHAYSFESLHWLGDRLVQIVDSSFGVPANDVSFGLAPSVSVDLRYTQESVREDTNLTNGLKVATFDVVGLEATARQFRVTGPDADMFEIRGHDIRLKPGSALSVKSNPTLDAQLEVVAPDAGITLAEPISIRVTPRPGQDDVLLVDVEQRRWYVGLNVQIGIHTTIVDTWDADTTWTSYVQGDFN